MPGSDSTRWTVIRAAAEGDAAARAAFARRYEHAIRAYLGARWRDSVLRTDIDDAAQEIFVDFFRENGALSRADPDRRGGFRAYLYGVVRNVARNFERRRARNRARPPDSSLDLDRFEAGDEAQSKVFDRAWASAVLKEAADRMAERAVERGDGAAARVSLLEMRFTDGLPIREIARLKGENPARMHHEYAKARREFRDALLAVVAHHHPGSTEEIEAECAGLLDFFD